MINIQCLIFYQAAKLQNLFRNLRTKVENNCSETFTATATSENGYNAVITVEFEAIN